MTQKNETVLLLHGLGRTRLSMRPLARALEAAGYQTACWQYNSVRGSIPAIAERIKARLPELGSPHKLHGIGHSMGGLLLRSILSTTDLPLGRLVLVGTPSAGAGIIEHHQWLFGRSFVPPALSDMRPGSVYLNALPLPDMEIGVVAGVERFNPVNPASWLNRWSLGDVPHDGTVELSSVKLMRMADYFEVPVNHSFLPTNRRVIPAVVRFIETGKFQAG